MKRPQPPNDIFTSEMIYITPANDVKQWVMDSIISVTGNIHNPDHLHLDDADICFLWAASSFTKQGRSILGQTERLMFRAGGWQKARAEQQMIQWFGHIPEFLITLAADYCASCSDAEFCALVEHELYHIAQAVDDFGAPKFKEDGNPKLMIRGHDVEEFTGVVRRYGASEQVKEMIKAASKKAEVSALNIAHACGTCQLKLA